MANDRLRERLASTGKSATDLASELQVDPKTVERWIRTGRVPRMRHRYATAEALGVEPSYLWPDVPTGNMSVAQTLGEVITIYPTRASVPADLWRRLVDGAQEQIDVLVYSGLFLLDSQPGFPKALVDRSAAGLKARFLYGKPESASVAHRGAEEGIGDGLGARIRLALTYMAAAGDTPGVEIRQHETVLYNSLYRFDDELLVNTHAAGSPAAQNPVLHLRQVDGGHLFDHYLQSFEWVWSSASVPAEA
jgi:transcriptional regulator with XRE-family HTH domain